MKALRLKHKTEAQGAKRIKQRPNIAGAVCAESNEGNPEHAKRKARRAMREVNTQREHAIRMAKEAQSKSQVQIATYHVAKAILGSETAGMNALTRAANSC